MPTAARRVMLSEVLLGTTPEKAEALAADLAGDVRAGAVGDPLSGDLVAAAGPSAARVQFVGSRCADYLSAVSVVQRPRRRAAQPAASGTNEDRRR